MPGKSWAQEELRSIAEAVSCEDALKLLRRRDPRGAAARLKRAAKHTRYAARVLQLEVAIAREAEL